MVPYCLLFFLLDTLIVWRVVNWFNAKIDYQEIVPIRASSYILSILNEQVSKGAVALYLNRRAGVPGWEVGSSMLFIMFCEFYYLLTFATIGVLLQWERFPEVFHVIPWLTLPAPPCSSSVSPVLPRPDFSAQYAARQADLPFLPQGKAVVLRGHRPDADADDAQRGRRLHAGAAAVRRRGDLRGDARLSPGHLLRRDDAGADALGGDCAVGRALSGASGRITAFGFVQHNFFMLFNAAIGLLFVRRATRELLRSAAMTSAPCAIDTRCWRPGPADQCHGRSRPGDRDEPACRRRWARIEDAVVAAKRCRAAPWCRCSQ